MSAKIICSLVISLWAGCGATGQAPTPPADSQPIATLENKIKAGFLYNFAKFTEWPSNTFALADDRVRVAVLGDAAFAAALTEVLGSKNIDGRKFSIQSLKEFDPTGQYHLLFVGAEQSGRLERLIDQLDGHAILTVSGQEGFARAGGMIELLKPGPGPKFEVNLPAATRAGLRLDPRLLKIATIFNGGVAAGRQR